MSEQILRRDVGECPHCGAPMEEVLGGDPGSPFQEILAAGGIWVNHHYPELKHDRTRCVRYLADQVKRLTAKLASY